MAKSRVKTQRKTTGVTLRVDTSIPNGESKPIKKLPLEPTSKDKVFEEYQKEKTYVNMWGLDITRIHRYLQLSNYYLMLLRTDAGYAVHTVDALKQTYRELFNATNFTGKYRKKIHELLEKARETAYQIEDDIQKKIEWGEIDSAKQYKTPRSFWELCDYILDLIYTAKSMIGLGIPLKKVERDETDLIALYTQKMIKQREKLKR